MDNIFIKSQQIGYAQLSGFSFVQGWPLLLVIFAFCDVIKVYKNLDLLLDNMINTIAAVTSILKLRVFRMKPRALMTLINKILDDSRQTKKTIDESKVMMNNFDRSKSLGTFIIWMYNGILLTITFKPVFHACSKIDSVRREIVKFSKVCRLQSGNKVLIMTAMRRLIQNIEDGGDAVKTFHYGVMTIIMLISCGYYCITGEYLTSQSYTTVTQKYIFIFNKNSCLLWKYTTAFGTTFRFLNKKLSNLFWLNLKDQFVWRLEIVILKVSVDYNLRFNNFSLQIIKTSFSYLSLVRKVH
ncbi:hypothetical protein TSAR_011973 [Trichomalopsis sarcophagae]|uniref:Uncharacterized protein n=1 Tax=Trichomalopsis sarcophagae TaxID=543379 RepID=A0A232FJF2_9HYME|nr:hypothetical protein TSAR_011973 [Trichomalopsis sarcophagae]